MRVDAVPRESKPLQADGWVFVAARWLKFNCFSFLSLSAFAACSAIDKFPEPVDPFPKVPDRRPLKASPFEGGVGFEPFD